MAPLMVKVRDAMDPNIVTVDENSPAIEAVRMMIKNGVWSVVVTKNGLYTGLMTERDFIRRCIIPGLDPNKTPVGELISCPLLTIDSDEALGKALQVMAQKNIRRLYIVENRKIIGRITQSNLLQKTLDTFQALNSVSQLL